jgi:outer membrane protein TolC
MSPKRCRLALSAVLAPVALAVIALAPILPAPSGLAVAADAADSDPDQAPTASDSAPAARMAPAMATSGSSAAALAGPAAGAATHVHASEAGAQADATATRIVERLLGEIAQAEGEPRRMSLAEAVAAAVANNPGIRSQAEVPNSAAWAPFGATGAFDPKFRANANGNSTKAPAGSALASGQQVFKEESIRGGVSISKLLRSGANVDLAWQTARIDTNSVFFTIDPRYDNRLTLSLRQPLLRNFWASRENTTVLVARSEAEESLAAFEAGLSRFVAGVIDSHWEYTPAAADLEVSRRSLALARELVRDAEARVAVGLLAPVAVKEAQADAAAREEKAIQAENALVVAGRDLQHQVMLGAAESKAPERVVPVEEHVVLPVELDRPSSLKTAVECRAEIRGATYALGRRRLEEKRARNERLPSVDLVGHYAMLGLAGDETFGEDGTVRPSPYIGNYGDSLDTMFGNNYQDYRVGIEIEVPFGNAEARASLAAAEIQVRRAARDLDQTVSTVALDVERAIADVAGSHKRVIASKAARELAEENMRNQQRRFELGAVTTKDVLDFQEKLAGAMASEVGAITDHARSVTRLRVAEGTLLARFGIEIQSPDAPGQPWWYKF